MPPATSGQEAWRFARRIIANRGARPRGDVRWLPPAVEVRLGSTVSFPESGNKPSHNCRE
jgi:hypothetical protein